MKKFLAYLISLVSFLAPAAILAQTTLPQIYFINNNVKVLVNDKPLPSAWSGGINTPQFGLADLNNDGKEDLVVYEDQVGVRTYVNIGTADSAAYVYDASYQLNFPKLRTYMKLVDYNHDGVADLVHRGDVGFTVYIGFYKQNVLDFKLYKDLKFLTNNGMIDAYCFGSDVPEVIDLDDDGDLDFISFGQGGNKVSVYKNCQVEDGLPKDSIKICYDDECWGRFYQKLERTIELGRSCDQSNTGCKGCPQKSANKGTHAGNTLCLLDIDGDKDLDVLNGNIAFSDVQFLKNGKNDLAHGIDTMIAQDTIWDAKGHAVKIDMYVAASHIDIDQDGDKDLLFSPQAKLFENYKSVMFYENTGSDSAPDFNFKTDNYLVDNMIDAGVYSYPTFYDYNKDGKPDLFVGSRGYYQPDGSYKTMVSYYENVSEKGSPTLKLVTNDFIGLGSKVFNGAALAFGDVDNDGMDDMVIGQENGSVLMFKNVAASNTVQPIWSASLVRPLAEGTRQIAVGNSAKPVVYDIDADGNNDLICGNALGQVIYFKNTGTTNNALFTRVTDSLGGVAIYSMYHADKFSAPFIGAIDDSKKPYLLVGTTMGTISIYDGLQGGNVTTPYTRRDSAYQKIQIAPRSAPATADIDGDGLYEMVLGNELGGLNLYRQIFNVGVGNLALEKTQIRAYPNPTKDILNLAWSDQFGDGEIEIKLVNATGQTVVKQMVHTRETVTQVRIGDLPQGIYYCIVQSAGNRGVTPVTIVR